MVRAVRPRSLLLDRARPRAFAPAAVLVRGALLAYLLPRLTMSAKKDGVAMIDQSIKGLTSRNYRDRRWAVIGTLKDLAQGRLAHNEDLDDLECLFQFLGPEIECADEITLTVLQDG